MRHKTILKHSPIKLSPHLHHDEFRCKCRHKDCTLTQVDELLLELFETLRAEYGLSIFVSSGFRCQEHNAKVGGVVNSNHILGSAIDLIKPKKNTEKFISLCRTIFPYTKEYESFVHCDTRAREYLV